MIDHIDIKVKNPNYKEFELVFGFSKSPNYNKALEILEYFDSSYTINNENGNILHHLPITINLLQHQYPYLEKLINKVYRFKTAKLYSATESNTLNVTLLREFHCFYKTVKTQKYSCFNCAYDYDTEWYCYGYLNDNNEFIINKDQLINMVENNKTICPIYCKNTGLEYFDNLPDKIIADEIKWGIGEVFEGDYPKLGIMPMFKKRGTINCSGYWNESNVVKSIRSIERIIDQNESSDKLLNRGIQEVYILINSYGNCCLKCEENQNKVFNAKHVLNKWYKEKIIPIPVLGCEEPNYGCRCIWSKWIPELYYIKNNRVEFAVDEESIKEHAKWLNAHPHIRVEKT